MEFQRPTIGQMNANGTHVPILVALLSKTTGPIIELGSGHYSTPLLNYHSKISGRFVLSVDTNREWNDYFANNFHAENHKFYCTDNRLISNIFLSSPWGTQYWDIAFIDCGPDIDRIKCLELFRNKARFIIIHDTEPAARVYSWGNIFDSFPHKFYWDFYGNGTSVVSMSESCSWLL